MSSVLKTEAAERPLWGKTHTGTFLPLLKKDVMDYEAVLKFRVSKLTCQSANPDLEESTPHPFF